MRGNTLILIHLISMMTSLHYMGTRSFRCAWLFLSLSYLSSRSSIHTSPRKEQVSIRYESRLLGQDFKNLLKESFPLDSAAQYTTVGIHKDDLLLEINGQLVKKFASQGQQKSFLIALKLAQFHCLYKQTKITPILLLDDIFDKLDSKRVAQLISLVTRPPFGQVFLSDTDKERTENIVKETTSNYHLFYL